MDAGTAVVIGAAVGGLIGFGGKWLSGWQQGAAESKRRDLEIRRAARLIDDDI